MERDKDIIVAFVNENFQDYQYWNGKTSFTFKGKKLKGKYQVEVVKNGEKKIIKQYEVEQTECKMLRRKIKYHYN